MKENSKEKIELFLNDITEKVREGMSYSDAMQLCAVITGGTIAAYVSQAINKYQEAIYEKTELSKQINVDECALASMGKLWHGENFEGLSEQIESSEEETITDALYFILKYARLDRPLEEALKANDNICGDKKRREVLIKKAFDIA